MFVVLEDDVFAVSFGVISVDVCVASVGVLSGLLRGRGVGVGLVGKSELVCV